MSIVSHNDITSCIKNIGCRECLKYIAIHACCDEHSMRDKKKYRNGDLQAIEIWSYLNYIPKFVDCLIWKEIIIGLLLIKRPILLSHLNLNLIQIGLKAPPPPPPTFLPFGEILSLCHVMWCNLAELYFIHHWTSQWGPGRRAPPSFLPFCERPGSHQTCRIPIVPILQIDTHIPSIWISSLGYQLCQLFKILTYT